jgi:PAS domain S-box-containing protein
MSCEYVSRAWLTFTGFTADQALCDGWSRGVHPEDLGRWLDTCVRAFDARATFEIEYRLRCRDDGYRWVLERAVPRYGADGSFLGYVGSCVDIHDRKRLQEIMSCVTQLRQQLPPGSEAARALDAIEGHARAERHALNLCK